MAYKDDVKQLKSKLDEQKKIFDAQDRRAEDAKKAGQPEDEAMKAADPTKEETEQLKKLDGEIKELDARCAESKEYQDIRDRAEALRASIAQPVNRPDFGNPNVKQENRSLGYRFAASDEFKSWFTDRAVVDHEGKGELPPEGDLGRSKPFMIDPFESKALITGVSQTSAGALTRREYAPLVDFPFQPLTLRDIITVGRTGTDLIEYPRVTGYTSAAAPVAEATGTAGTSGLKPESSMTLVKETTSVKTIAHWIPATRRAMQDAPQIETLINNFLDVGLELELEDQIIKGTGTGEDFRGLDNTPDITLQAFDTDILTTARKARTKAVIVGRARSTAFVMHPEDWERFDLFKDNENRYYFGGPMAMGTKMLWGLPVVESEALHKGTFYTGDLKQAILWDRERATIRVSDAPGDFFLRNMLAILAELRAAFGVFRPPAIVRGDLVAGPNS